MCEALQWQRVEWLLPPSMTWAEWRCLEFLCRLDNEKLKINACRMPMTWYQNRNQVSFDGKKRKDQRSKTKDNAIAYKQWREKKRETTRSTERNIPKAVETEESRNNGRAWSSGRGDQRDHHAWNTEEGSKGYSEEESWCHGVTSAHVDDMFIFVFLLYGEWGIGYHFTSHITLCFQATTQEE